MNQSSIGRWCVVAVAMVAAFMGVRLRSGAGANIEPAIIPTVHAALTPTSAIQVPLRFIADRTSVWRSDAEQRMLLSGRVQVIVGYRTLRSDEAAVWLTPSRESGENTFDVAIYLSGSVQVREGNSASSTLTSGKELLVTTRISQNVQLEGSPVSKSEEDSPIIKRGNEIRNEIATRPLAPLQIPRVVITPVEEALQSGWIARGENNKIVPGPGDIQIVRDSQGNVVTAPINRAARAARPRPTVFISFDPGGDTRGQQVGKEIVTVLPGVYMLFDFQTGRPPLEFRAQRAVVFSPATEDKAPATATSTAPATATKPAPAAGSEVTQLVTGVYLEGDVTLDQGDKIMVRAERIYFDLTTQRAVMLDATLSAVDEKLNIPIYMRAAEIRQLSRGEFAAKKVSFSASEFYTPHYHIGASEAYLRDITPQLQGLGGDQAGGGGVPGFGDAGDLSAKTFQYELKNTTLNVGGVPIFYWPFLSGDTSKDIIPLRTAHVSNSHAFGISLETNWDLFALTGQVPPEGVSANLSLDYYGKRGPAAGVNADWQTDQDHGMLRSYALLDQGTDDLGHDRRDIVPNNKDRGSITVRDQKDLGDGWTLQLEGSYVSDPTFLEQFFRPEFNTDKEHETSAYLKKQGQTDAASILVKDNLMNFTTTADQIDDQFSVDKLPEAKYFRIGDSLLDLFTYYSESGLANVHADITNYSPGDLRLLPHFLGLPAGFIPPNGATLNDQVNNYLIAKFRTQFVDQGWLTKDVLRVDSRHEIDMPLQVGDGKITPYVTGRVTAWDTNFPEGNSGSTTRLWGGGGVRGAVQFWKVYQGAQSVFFDVHELRHVIEPQFNLFVSGSSEDRRDLQPYDRDVEGITGASGTQLSINQKWQTKRGGEGHWRDVDWIVFNVSWSQFWNKDKTGGFSVVSPARGYYFASRPELSQDTSAINVDGIWRIGERVRLLGDANYSVDGHRIEQAAMGFAVDQSPTLSYFFGDRYIQQLKTSQFTVGVDYQLTQKYQIIATESFDTKAQRFDSTIDPAINPNVFKGYVGGEGQNILTSVSLVRRMPRFNFQVTLTYDANQGDTTFSITAWPEGLGGGNLPGSAHAFTSGR